jgi:hypothetical protein
MKLIETVEMMNSDDFKERFRAEYFQLKIRTRGLSSMLEKYEKGTLQFEPKCTYEMLNEQLIYMNMYKACMENRAIAEDIDLN